jgi:hypothetical protein
VTKSALIPIEGPKRRPEGGEWEPIKIPQGIWPISQNQPKITTCKIQRRGNREESGKQQRHRSTREIKQTKPLVASGADNGTRRLPRRGVSPTAVPERGSKSGANRDNTVENRWHLIEPRNRQSTRGRRNREPLARRRNGGTTTPATRLFARRNHSTATRENREREKKCCDVGKKPLSKTETRGAAVDVTQPAGALCEKLMGSEPAWNPELAVEKPEQNREEPLKNRRHCEEPDSKPAACKTETEENHGERGAARSPRRESRLGSRACDGNQV